MEPSHRFVFIHDQTLLLGRHQTLDPCDEFLPEVQFEVRADVLEQTMLLYVIEGGGYLNGEFIEEDEMYYLQNGDIIGFSPHYRHNYEVTFTQSDTDDDDDGNSLAVK